MIKKTTKWSTLLLMLFSTIFVAHVNAYGGRGFQADQWFTYTATVNQQTLPTGVIVENNTLINTTSVPLIILNGTQEMWMLKSSQLFYERETGKGFIKTTPFKGYDFTTQNSKIIDDELILDRPLENIYQDNRSSNISLPKPHTFTINAIYNGKPLQITGNIEYKLNPNYDPHKLINYEKSKKFKDNLPIILGIVLIGFITLLIKRLAK